jgi:hypothetical protein
MADVDTFQIQMTFSPYLWLDILTDVSVYDSVKKFSDSHLKDEDKLSIIRGYGFILIACLHEFVDSVIRSPDVLDFPFDEGLKDAWASSRNRGRDSLTRLIKKDSPVSCVLNLITVYWNDILKASSWEQLDPIRVKLADLMQTVGRGFRFSFKGSTSQRESRMNLENILRLHALDYLWPHMVTIGVLSRIYSDVYLRSSRSFYGDLLPDDWAQFKSRPTTRFDEPDDLTFPKRPPVSWVVGYVFSLELLIKQLAPEDLPTDILKLTSKLKDISSWTDLNKLGRAIPLPFMTPPDVKIRKVRPYPKSILRTLMLPVEHGFKANQLLGIMGCPLKVVESDTLSAPHNFARLLRGSVLVAREHKEKVRIIRLLHKEHHTPTSYSLAIFMPVYTLISNWSTWWVFFDLYSEDAESKPLRETVQSVFSELKDDIEIEEYPISEEELLSIAEDPGFTYLKEELSAAKNVNWNLRGTLPELLIAVMFGAMNCHPIRIGIKPAFLEGKEIDVTAVSWQGGRPTAFNVLECKGYSVSSDIDLQNALDKFSENVSKIRKHGKELANIMNLTCTPKKVRAIFISMADLGYIKLRIPKNLEVWGFDDFVKELGRQQVPDWHLRLLRKSSVAMTIAFGEGIQKFLFDEGK